MDLVDSILNMQLDVYRQIDVQDENTGAIKREWEFYKTLSCHAKGSISNSATTKSTDKQSFANKYSYEQNIQVRTLDRLTAREKITNIRDAKNRVIWTEIDFPEETPTVFEVVGTTPMLDPFGNLVGYNSSLKRSENQQIGI